MDNIEFPKDDTELTAFSMEASERSFSEDWDSEEDTIWDEL